jgi:hypothetical protein
METYEQVESQSRWSNELKRKVSQFLDKIHAKDMYTPALNDEIVTLIVELINEAFDEGYDEARETVRDWFDIGDFAPERDEGRD